MAGVAAYVVFWVLLLLRLRWPVPGLRWPILLALLVWVTLAASLMIDWRDRSGRKEGVVTAESVVVRKGNGRSYDPQFEEPLTEGVEFDVLEARGGWLHVELPDGQDGWVPESSASPI